MRLWLCEISNQFPITPFYLLWRVVECADLAGLGGDANQLIPAATATSLAKLSFLRVAAAADAGACDSQASCCWGFVLVLLFVCSVLVCACAVVCFVLLCALLPLHAFLCFCFVLLLCAFALCFALCLVLPGLC